MKLRIAVEVECIVEAEKITEIELDDFVEDFCKTSIESANDYCKEYGLPVSLKYIENVYTTNGVSILGGDSNEDNA